MAVTVTSAVVPQVNLGVAKPPRILAGTMLTEWQTQERETVLVAGAPKGAGKTTLALSMGKKEDYTIVIACDHGKLSVPPHRDRSRILVLPYQDLTREFTETGGHSKPKRDVYMKLTGDLYTIYKAVKEQKAIQLGEGKEFPPPQNIILDGMSRLNSMLVDGQCAMNSIDDPSDLDNKAFKFWGKRLRDTLCIVEQFACLPCSVCMTTWIDQVKDSDGKPTGVWYPDVGGKMDMLSAGTVGAALFAYSRQGRFYVRTKADGAYPWVGVRDRYKLASEIDVTIDDTPAGSIPAWQRIFGGGQ